MLGTLGSVQTRLLAYEVNTRLGMTPLSPIGTNGMELPRKDMPHGSQTPRRSGTTPRRDMTRNGTTPRQDMTRNGLMPRQDMTMNGLTSRPMCLMSGQRRRRLSTMLGTHGMALHLPQAYKAYGLHGSPKPPKPLATGSEQQSRTGCVEIGTHGLPRQ